MEFLDIVDEDDNVIGSASKEDIYNKKLTHRIVHIFIFNDKNEMALQMRGKNVPFCALCWCTAAAGHVSSGETYEEAAIRESEEELGIKPAVKFAYKDFYQRNMEPVKSIKKILVSFKALSNGPFNIDEKTVEKIEFFTLDEIQEMINRGEKFHPELLFLLRKHYGLE